MKPIKDLSEFYEFHKNNISIIRKMNLIEAFINELTKNEE